MANHAARDEHEFFPCPRCGADAEWSFLDESKTTVQVMCANCGRVEMTRESFDQATTENAELTGQE
jgi:uncharacterized Zn finger protein